MRRGFRGAVLALAAVNLAVLGGSIGVWAVGLPERPVPPHLVERDPVAVGPVLPQASSQGADGNPNAAGKVDVPAAVADAVRSSAVGPGLAAMVLDPVSGKALLRRGVREPATPASTIKILTATAALASLGPEARLTTEVVRDPGSRTITLVGGGDPTLASPKADHTYPKPAQLGRLAKQTARAVRESGTTTVRLRYDTSLFKGAVTAGTWKPNYVPSGYVAPVTALSVDSGRADPVDPEATHLVPSPRVGDPPRVAATLFARLLEDAGVTVRGDVAAGRAPDGAGRVAAVRSPTMAVLVEQMLMTSDNDLAEALGRHVALAVGKPPTFRGATAAVEQVIAGLDVQVGRIEMYDCSGLSHENTVTARALARTLSLAVGAHPELRPVLTGLPVAGYSGTLGERYDDGSRGAGYVRAKTGTLNHVTSLAGVAHRPDGRMLVFAFLANDVPLGATDDAEAILDGVAARLARR